MPEIPFADRAEGQWIPEVDGVDYGCFLMEEADAEACYGTYASLGETARLELAMNLYENLWRKRIDAARFLNWACEALYGETNPLIFGALLGYAGDALRFSGNDIPLLEHTLRLIAEDTKRPHEMRLQAFRSLVRQARDPKNCDWLLAVWEQQRPPRNLTLGENDYTNLSYQLMLRFPDRAADIRAIQRARIIHPDRIATFDFVAQAAAPTRTERDAFFDSLAQAENRRPESRVLAALDLLCSPLLGDEPADRITPALKLLPEIQRTGDIFFPASWCRRILGAQTSERAKEEVEAFLASHADMHPLLKTKVLLAAGYLLQ
jgi:aminopeptidase N